MDEIHSDARDPSGEEEASAGEARKRLAAYILGALTTGGSLGLLAWTAQAHGNRSSHSAPLTRSAAPDQPKPPTRGRDEPETAPFLEEEALPDRGAAPEAAPAPEPVPPPADYAMQRARVLAPNAASTKRLAELSELITGDAEEERRIQAERAALVKQILLGSITGDVLKHLEADEAEMAWTRIESQGDDLQVLRNYRAIMTDLDHLSRKDGRSTPANLPAIVRVAAAAQRFATERAKTRETWETRSEYMRCLFDVAALTVPDDGVPAPEILAKGGRAADACLALAQDLGLGPRHPARPLGRGPSPAEGGRHRGGPRRVPDVRRAGRGPGTPRRGGLEQGVPRPRPPRGRERLWGRGEAPEAQPAGGRTPRGEPPPLRAARRRIRELVRPLDVALRVGRPWRGRGLEGS